ncbi:VOC family protein [Asticcacaulis sp. AND118]|uniref:VOC family protein n=1 Tax=Asticcacaulis sp. AND118 TaxID=2840468 RepID=UPI001CFFC7C9|nr:VOC family protein [Asticcacaulis sp. AND118]UDF02650.1 VOC family protein [Asticcacaulis sp. AND118]
MDYHTGRLIDHVHLVVRDLEAAKRFYKSVVAAVKPGAQINEGEDFLQVDELYISQGELLSHIHLSFQAADQDAVQSFYDAALKAGGRDNGGPGERDYHPGYYGGFVYDPDGNNIEATYHGPSTRSAEDVVITPTGG